MPMRSAGRQTPQEREVQRHVKSNIDVLLQDHESVRTAASARRTELAALLALAVRIVQSSKIDLARHGQEKAELIKGNQLLYRGFIKSFDSPVPREVAEVARALIFSDELLLWGLDENKRIRALTGFIRATGHIFRLLKHKFN
ncbi:MAG: hypothetical protein Q9182_003471 [Xanthomendoza sp. 2 TL-2023]